MKFIKKVSSTPLTDAEGHIIDSFNTSDDHTTNAPSLNAVEQYTKRQIATARFTGDKTSLSGGVMTFDLFKGTSSNLTLSGGGIRIGKGISKVLVSGNVFFQWTSANQNYIYMEIRKVSNGTPYDVSIAIQPQPFNYAYTSLSFSPYLEEVQEGDVFYIVSLEGKTGTYRGYQNTWLTVEVVE